VGALRERFAPPKVEKLNASARVVGAIRVIGVVTYAASVSRNNECAVRLESGLRIRKVANLQPTSPQL
jgi:hypothetical protein